MSEPLGLILWYTVTGGETLDTTRNELKQWLTDAGMDPALVPGTSRSIDAFRAATTGATDTYQLGERVITLEVREIRQTPEHVMRHVVRLDKGPGGASQTKVAEMQFFRPVRVSAGRLHGTERIRTVVDRRLRGLDKERVTALVQRCEQAYEAALSRMSPQQVRSVVRNYLTSIGAVPVVDFGGGAYLLMPEQGPRAASLADVVAKCGPECRVRVIPLIDQPELRSLIVESIDTEMADRAGALLREVVEQTRVTPARRATWRAGMHQLQEWLIQYGDRYDAAFPRAAGAIEQLIELTAG